jgi:hypothetical protein
MILILSLSSIGDLLYYLPASEYFTSIYLLGVGIVLSYDHNILV